MWWWKSLVKRAGALAMQRLARIRFGMFLTSWGERLIGPVVDESGTLAGAGATTHQLHLTAYQTVANADITVDFPPTHPGNLTADFALRINRVRPEDGTFNFMLFGELLKSECFIGNS
jgi:hypothetical protein